MIAGIRPFYNIQLFDQKQQLPSTGR